MNARNVASSGKPTVISLFAGCGGSSLGYQMAGFKELLAVEWDSNAVRTFKLNFPDVPVYQGDICKLTSQECIRLAGIEPFELDILDGSPPCQGFSIAGRQKFNDPRNNLFQEFGRLLQDLQPKAFVMENVGNMIQGKMKAIFREATTLLRNSGYSVKCSLMDAQYFNVPHRRRRLIWIGTRNDLDILPSHPKPQSIPITVRQALEGLPKQYEDRELPNREKVLYRWTKKGESLSDAAYRILGQQNCNFTHWRLAWDKICPTILASRGSAILHPDECRSLTIPELKRLASFPDSFEVIGSFSQQWLLIGNSVPPNLMKAIAEYIRANILDKL